MTSGSRVLLLLLRRLLLLLLLLVIITLRQCSCSVQISRSNRSALSAAKRLDDISVELGASCSREEEDDATSPNVGGVHFRADLAHALIVALYATY